jgi:hypothetical protein
VRMAEATVPQTMLALPRGRRQLDCGAASLYVAQAPLLLQVHTLASHLPAHFPTLRSGP